MIRIIWSPTPYTHYILLRLHHRLGLPYTNVAVGLALFLGGVVGVVEYFVPWQTEVPVSLPTALACTHCLSLHLKFMERMKPARATTLLC